VQRDLPLKENTSFSRILEIDSCIFEVLINV